MKCPHCNEVLKFVLVETIVTEQGRVEDSTDGPQVVELYDRTMEHGDTLCPFCYDSLDDLFSSSV
jgi:hypothetical protein